MRICRFDHDRLGLVEGDDVFDVTPLLDRLPVLRWPYPKCDALIAHWPVLAPHVAAARQSAARIPLAAVRLESPVANPTKIIGIARNRRDLAKEIADPGVAHGKPARSDGDPIEMFIKAPSALVGPAAGVSLRFPDRRNDPEAELAVVIGKPGTDISPENALEHVFGYAIGLDMTLRGKESMSSRKSIDTYAVVGPWIVTADEISNPDDIDTRLSINGHVLQQANTCELAFDIKSLIAHASTFYTLLPGDVIMVGTPAGFAQVQPGDTMVAEFEHIGRMQVAVRAHEQRSPAGAKKGAT